jgi:hypothetical protein
MDKQFKVPEPVEDLVPVRRACFGKRFWEIWNAMIQPHRDAYLLGWIAELEGLIRRLERRIERIENREEDDSS